MDDELKLGAGSPQNQETSTPKSENPDEKTAGGRPTQPPVSAGMGGFPFGIPGMQIPNSPAELGRDPLKEGARERFREVIEGEEHFPEGDFDERLERRKESFGKIEPAMSEDEKNNNATVIELLRKETLDNDDEQQLVTALSGNTKDEARIILDTSNHPEETKDKIISQLPESRETEEKEPSNAEEEQRRANLEVSQEFLNESESKIEEEIAKKDASHDDKHIRRFERTSKKIKELQEKMDEFLHPEDPLKTWSKRGGLVFYYALLTAFILILIEMNLIHKTAAKK